MTTKTLGQFIRELREARGMSLRDLASRIKVSAPFMSDVERDRRDPSDQRIAEIARELEVSPEYLKQFDTRSPVREIRRAIDSNPGYNFAFRRVVDSNMSPEEILDFVEERDRRLRDDERDSER